MSVRHDACSREHQTFRAAARCVYGGVVVRNTEDGPFVLLSECPGMLTLTVWPTLAQADAEKRLLDSLGCGGRCGGRHHITWVDTELAA